MPHATVDFAGARDRLVRELNDKEEDWQKAPTLELWTILHRFAVSGHGTSVRLNDYDRWGLREQRNLHHR